MAEFNYIERMKELLKEGLSDEEIEKILEKEESEADYTVLDDSSWDSILASAMDDEEPEE